MYSIINGANAAPYFAPRSVKDHHLEPQVLFNVSQMPMVTELMVRLTSLLQEQNPLLVSLSSSYHILCGQQN